MNGTNLPPIISVRMEKVVPTDQGFIVQFVVKNTGDSTAKNVSIEGVLKENGKAIEKSSATIDFAPSHAERHMAALFFLMIRANTSLTYSPKATTGHSLIEN
jgi:uncharacterized protein (TIGR02588 family)